jgi:hypothetical protein
LQNNIQIEVTLLLTDVVNLGLDPIIQEARDLDDTDLEKGRIPASIAKRIWIKDMKMRKTTKFLPVQICQADIGSAMIVLFKRDHTFVIHPAIESLMTQDAYWQKVRVLNLFYQEVTSKARVKTGMKSH